jgi:hypothetical protein
LHSSKEQIYILGVDINQVQRHIFDVMKFSSRSDPILAHLRETQVKFNAIKGRFHMTFHRPSEAG